MSTQIAVRLPDETVAFIDALVRDGEATSRADVVAQAVAQERRRRDQEREIAILLSTKDDADPDDVAGFIAYTKRTFAAAAD